MGSPYLPSQGVVGVTAQEGAIQCRKAAYLGQYSEGLAAGMIFVDHADHTAPRKNVCAMFGEKQEPKCCDELMGQLHTRKHTRTRHLREGGESRR